MRCLKTSLFGTSRERRARGASQGRAVFSGLPWLAPPARLFLLTFALAETITHAADGLDQLAVIAQLAAQRLDMHVDGSFQDDRAFLDGRVHELGTCEGPALLAQHALADAELCRC